mgnify:FL=1
MMDAILNWCDNLLENDIWFYLITTVIKLVLMFAVILAFVVLSVWIERRVAGWIQDRPGPNRAVIPLTLFKRYGSKEKQPLKKVLHYFGIPETCWIAKLCTWLKLDRDIPTFGLMQPCLDGGKLFLKQENTPSYVRKIYFTIAPMLVLGPPMVAAAVVPFASSASTCWGDINMVVANIGIGPLWIFAISGLSVYGLTMAGWSSNSKFPFLGGLRATAQLISYEVAMGLSIIPLLMMFGTLNLQDIVSNQAANGWTLLPLWGEGLSLQRWAMMVPMALSFVIFVTCVFAEANRTPFDMAECETDLVGGYHTEYSSMKFASFFMGEYAAMVIGSALVVTLFLGGWSIGFGLDEALASWCDWVAVLCQFLMFLIKLVAFIFFFVWVRWTMPRFRWDQVMKLGWLVFLELAVANIFLTAAVLYFIK